MNHPRTRLAVSVITGAVTALGLLPALPASAAVDYCGPSYPSANWRDLNGDGYEDAAVGDPYATVAGQAEAGAVTLLFGDADGRIGEGARRVITQADFGETPEAGDHFGWDLNLAKADTGESCANLLIGSPGEDLNGAVDAGIAHLAGYFSADVGDPPKLYAQRVTQADAGGAVEPGDEFGTQVAIWGTPSDEIRRIMITAPGEAIGSVTDAGAVSLYTGSQYGAVMLYQGKLLPGGKVRVPGTPERGDRFGASLAVGSVHLGGGLGIGMAIGAPGDMVAGHDGAGSVTVVKHGEDWFDGVSLLTQNTPGVPGGAEAGDSFGYSVALSSRRGNTGPRTLAVGAPGEDAGTVANAGSVTLVSNPAGRLAPWTAFSQNTAGVPGSTEAGDRFGHALVFGFNTPHLWVGVPTEDIGSTADAGLVQPVQVPGPTYPLVYETPITEAAPDSPGTAGTGNKFGNVLAALYGEGENLMTASSVYAGVGSVWVLSDAVAEDSDRTWVPGRGGIPTAGASRFGWSVSN